MNKYHKNYSGRSEEDILRRIESKRLELAEIFSKTCFKTPSSPVRVAVLGCADKRFVKPHKQLFEELLKKKVELTTFDVDTNHLAGENGIVEHDVTEPLPGTPYDITFAHVLLKFIPEDLQWNVICNSYNALRSPGLAIHVFGDEETSDTVIVSEGQYPVRLDKLTDHLDSIGVQFKTWSIKIRDIEEKPFTARLLVIKI